MNTTGFDISKRQLERDLRELQGSFPLDCDEQKPAGWCWAKGSRSEFTAFGMDPHTALAFLLAEQYLHEAFPKPTLRRLKDYFHIAQRVLENQRETGTRRWYEMLRIIPRGMPTLVPDIPVTIEDAISDSLLQKRQIVVEYQKSTGESKEYSLHPRGIVVRNNVVYLVAEYDGAQGTRQFALHRIRKATLSDSSYRDNPNFNLDDYIANGSLGLPVGKGKIRIKVRFPKDVYHSLAEQALSVDQVLKDEDSQYFVLEASVADNMELRWWLLGFGAKAEVLEPSSLREEMKRTAEGLAKIYLR
jgi:predicted DNA-binding transcriptional regulator YafY